MRLKVLKLFNFLERKNLTILHQPIVSETSICDLCGSFECAIKGSNSFCSKNWIDMTSSLMPSAADRTSDFGRISSIVTFLVSTLFVIFRYVS